jgi:hypothetical protein
MVAESQSVAVGSVQVGKPLQELGCVEVVKLSGMPTICGCSSSTTVTLKV